MILKRSRGGALIWVTSDSAIRRWLGLRAASVSLELIDQVMRDSS